MSTREQILVEVFLHINPILVTSIGQIEYRNFFSELVLCHCTSKIEIVVTCQFFFQQRHVYSILNGIPVITAYSRCADATKVIAETKI